MDRKGAGTVREMFFFTSLKIFLSRFCNPPLSKLDIKVQNYLAKVVSKFLEEYEQVSFIFSSVEEGVLIGGQWHSGAICQILFFHATSTRSTTRFFTFLFFTFMSYFLQNFPLEKKNRMKCHRDDHQSGTHHVTSSGKLILKTILKKERKQHLTTVG